MNANLVNHLKTLYSDTSKHSRYQNVPQFVREALDYREIIDEKWRGDTARYRYFRSAYDFANKRICDVGANTGFFTLSLAHAYRYQGIQMVALEGNPNHAEFIRLIADSFSLNNVTVIPRYVGFNTISEIPECDGVLHLNVMHHAGVDFDQEQVSDPADVYETAVNSMRRLRARVQSVIFQMGYNWGGNKQQPIVSLDDDVGKMVWTGRVMKEAGWKITVVATASQDEQGAIGYQSLSGDYLKALNAQPNSLREEDPALVFGANMTQLSEFYRRPVFIVERTGEKKT